MSKHPLETAMEKHGITVKAEFVPFSKSRNAGNKDERGNPIYSLNWKVTLQRNGRDVITTDYSAGIGHCPSYNKKAPTNWDRPVRFWQSAVCEWECENGFEAAMKPFMRDFTRRQKMRSQADLENGKPCEFFPILPGAANVVASLISDSDVLNYGKFEEWARDFGYDADSISAEKTYRACLEIALQVRAGLGETVLSELSEAARDY